MNPFSRFAEWASGALLHGIFVLVAVTVWILPHLRASQSEGRA